MDTICKISHLFNTTDRRQSKTLLTIDKHGSKISINRDLDCRLSPVGRKMAIKNSVSNNFLSTFFFSIHLFDCRLPSVFKEDVVPSVKVENFQNPKLLKLQS